MGKPISTVIYLQEAEGSKPVPVEEFGTSSAQEAEAKDMLGYYRLVYASPSPGPGWPRVWAEGPNGCLERE